MLTIGTHMSIAKGIAKTAENVVEMKANTMQIFSRNPRGSNYKTYTKEEIGRFQEIRRKNQFGPLLAHAPYTMNLASDKEKVYEFACTVIREDIARMDALGIENIVFHPGSHTGIGIEAGIRNIIAGLDQAITGEENITVLLITHYMEEVIDADKIYVMDHGRVVMEGTPKEVFSQVDELKKYRLDVPQVTILADELKKQGLDIPSGILRKEELVEALCQLD